MGYRSQVVMAVSPRKLGDLLTVLASNQQAFELFQQGLADGEKDYSEKGDVLLVWNHIKWYESFTCVGLFKSFMQDLADSDDDEEYRFVRVGENHDDIDAAGDYCCDIQPSTSITY